MSAAFTLKAPRALEHQEQAALFQYAAIQSRSDPRWGMLFAVPNGTSASSMVAAMNNKRTGLKKGVPDMFLAVPAGGKAGLFIELKRKGGKVSDVKDEQWDWLYRLNDRGYVAVVAFGWEDAVKQIEGYLGKNAMDVLQARQEVCG